MSEPYRVLVTGSRTWCASSIVYEALNRIAADTRMPLVVVHGGARGADALASTWVKAKPYDYGATEEEHKADWKRYGRAAGFRRNAEMVALGADLCLAFIRDGSRGATHCADLAEKAGIPVRRFTS
jgi:YspA, cpYpsA-related SLOG family